VGGAGVLFLGEGVEEGTEHGDARADVAQEGGGRAEDDAGGHDDDHALTEGGRKGGREGGRERKEGG